MSPTVQLLYPVVIVGFYFLHRKRQSALSKKGIESHEAEVLTYRDIFTIFLLGTALVLGFLLFESLFEIHIPVEKAVVPYYVVLTAFTWKTLQQNDTGLRNQVGTGNILTVSFISSFIIGTFSLLLTPYLIGLMFS